MAENTFNAVKELNDLETDLKIRQLGLKLNDNISECETVAEISHVLESLPYYKAYKCEIIIREFIMQVRAVFHLR